LIGGGGIATLAYAPGAYDAFEDDRLLNAAAEALRAAQGRLSAALPVHQSAKIRASGNSAGPAQAAF
jgi:hypothetical protein